jgi:hypothetical protein
MQHATQLVGTPIRGGTLTYGSIAATAPARVHAAPRAEGHAPAPSRRILGTGPRPSPLQTTVAAAAIVAALVVAAVDIYAAALHPTRTTTTYATARIIPMVD